MIIVTGTKRSGTSMWMQILRAAGYPVIGDAFPRDWGKTIRAANRAGFYESPLLRMGIHKATNPDPATGAYLCPEATRRTAVKVFAPGLARSESAFIYKVIGTMRDWREYQGSIERLYAIERDNRRALRQRRGDDPNREVETERMPALLEWWSDNYTLLRDVLVRRYPLRMVSYAGVLNAPRRMVPRALSWLGGGDLEAALAQVHVQLQTQHLHAATDIASGFGRDVEAVFDELYARVHEERTLDAAFIARLNQTHRALVPAIVEAGARVRESRRKARLLRHTLGGSVDAP